MRSFKNVMMSSFVVLSMASVPVIAQPVELTAGAGAAAAAPIDFVTHSRWAKEVLESRISPEADIFAGKSHEITKMNSTTSLKKEANLQLTAYGVTFEEVKYGMKHLLFMAQQLHLPPQQVLKHLLVQLNPVLKFMEKQRLPKKDSLVAAFMELARMPLVKRKRFLDAFMEQPDDNAKLKGLLYIFNQPKSASRKLVSMINDDCREDWDEVHPVDNRPVDNRPVIRCPWAKEVLESEVSPEADIFAGKSHEITKMNKTSLTSEAQDLLTAYGVTFEEVKYGMQHLLFIAKQLHLPHQRVLKHLLVQLNPVLKFMEKQRLPKKDSLVAAFMELARMPLVKRKRFLDAFVKQPDDNAKLKGLLYIFNQPKSASRKLVSMINDDCREDWDESKPPVSHESRSSAGIKRSREKEPTFSALRSSAASSMSDSGAEDDSADEEFLLLPAPKRARLAATATKTPSAAAVASDIIGTAAVGHGAHTISTTAERHHPRIRKLVYRAPSQNTTSAGNETAMAGSDVRGVQGEFSVDAPSAGAGDQWLSFLPPATLPLTRTWSMESSVPTHTGLLATSLLNTKNFWEQAAYSHPTGVDEDVLSDLEDDTDNAPSAGVENQRFDSLSPANASGIIPELDEDDWNDMSLEDLAWLCSRKTDQSGVNAQSHGMLSPQLHRSLSGVSLDDEMTAPLNGQRL